MTCEWTDRLSEYIDGELGADEQRAVEAHVEGCAACARTVDELRAVAARARVLPARPPASDLWGGIEARAGIARLKPRATGEPRASDARRFTFAAWQLAAAAALVAAVSGGLAWQIRGNHAASASTATAANTAAIQARPETPDADVPVVPVSLGDAQYDAAVADLQRVLDKERPRLDPATVAVVEHNLQIIDSAIAQAQRALAADPANSYLSGHLVETRRRKLDLLRRAAALVGDTD
jgi:anti-sigma factor RsiW